MAKDIGYRAQRRGDRGAYERYLGGMDASMRQKVALTAAHLLSEGKVADMGMGSGTGSEALAALYPALEVVGVDVEPTMVELARERYAHSNLAFEVGDIAKPVFEPASLDGILNSSVLHHVTSFNGYGAERAEEALAVQVEQLAERGVLIVRDFLAPEAREVFLDLPTGDGATEGDAAELSSAALFELFATRYRPLSDSPGFPCERVEELANGMRRYRVAAEHAVEFVLRKDYRRDWDSELLEAYTYFDQDAFESVYARLGLRVLASTPIWNPWIVEHRFRGKFSWSDLEGRPLEFPATNYLIVGEKVPEGEGVRFVHAGEAPAAGFLELSHHRDTRSGKVFDLVRRPHRTIDVIPWFESEGDVFVLARASYPRPIVCAQRPANTRLDGCRSAGYVVEPLVVVQGDKPLGMTVEECLFDSAGIASHRIRRFERGGHYYPSPGGIQEEVRAAFVEVEPSFRQQAIAASGVVGKSGFSTSGRVLSIEVQQLLRAAQVGGLPDARLELNAYDLSLRKGRSCGPWIGEAIDLGECDGSAPTSPTSRSSRRVFEQASAIDSSDFLRIHCEQFEERDRHGALCHASALEYVAPTKLSLNTVATALLRRHGEAIWLAVDDDDLPAAQGFSGNSELYVAPAWRLPRAVASMSKAHDWVREQLRAEYGVRSGRCWQLGGSYHPSLGLTPEVVYPLAVEVLADQDAQRPLQWRRLDDMVRDRNAYQDGHLRIVLLRAAHALGLLSA